VKTEEERTVRVSYLPVVTCEVCGRRLPHQPGEASQVLTGHYQSEHPEES
jgi:hypothetical protein